MSCEKFMHARIHVYYALKFSLDKIIILHGLFLTINQCCFIPEHSNTCGSSQEASWILTSEQGLCSDFMSNYMYFGTLHRTFPRIVGGML